ncbi:MAG: hypothetical protein EBR02_09795 [Alphaproteobacteria bacterium]|nr:hypothetical protein [Alphaproteobacteria bacterium]
MRLRTFIAADMPAAIAVVRDALGDSAIILSSETLSDKRISVTAAVEEHDEEAMIPNLKPAIKNNSHSAPKVSSIATDEMRHEIQNTLRFHNVPDLFIAKMMQEATNKNLRALSLENLLTVFFAFEPIALNARTKLMLVGAPGIGKTLTIAKMATRIAMENPDIKKEMTVITTDNKRAGGVEQLRAFTDILGIRLRVAGTLSELREHIDVASHHAPLLIDTAGCNPYDADDMAELGAHASLGIEPILAMQAGGDSMEAIDMAEAFSELPLERLLITRADTARRFGGVLACAAAHRLAFCNTSSSSSITDALAPLDGTRLAQFLLRYQHA